MLLTLDRDPLVLDGAGDVFLALGGCDDTDRALVLGVRLFF